MSKQMSDVVQKLEDAGVEIRRIEWKGDTLDIDCTPYEVAVDVFIEQGYLQGEDYVEEVEHG